jgi:formamidopyrimidine-DNA glycosylase
MPELPEVETLKLGLQKYLVGHTIESVELLLKKQFQGDPKDIIGAKVVGVRRFGKGLVIDLDNAYSLAIHIKLTGQLIYRGKDEPKVIHTDLQTVGNTLPNTWTRIIFHLDHEALLFYNDLRQFGWIKVVPTDKVGELSFFKELGPEFPLVKEDNGLSLEKFGQILSKSKTSIKPLLMDQQKMAGVGNIYANDSLYLAKIDPRRPANSLSTQEVKELFTAILTVLKKGLEEGGASELTFVNVLGEPGNYQNHSLVYGKKGEKCKRDGHTIEKISLGGRGTYFCPACQK